MTVNNEESPNISHLLSWESLQASAQEMGTQIKPGGLPHLKKQSLESKETKKLEFVKCNNR